LKVVPRRLLTCAVVLLVGTAWAGWRWFEHREFEHVRKNAVRLAHLGDRPKAIALFDQILLRDPDEPQALLYRAQFARDEGDRELALRLLCRVTDDHPREAGTASFVRATMALEDNHTREAERLYLRAIELNPSYPQPRERLAQLYANQIRGLPTRAVLDGLSRLRPLTIDELIVFTNATELSFRPDDAIPRLEGYIQGDPDDLPNWIALARYCLVDNRLDQSASVLEQALARNPREERLTTLLADTELRRGNIARVRELLEQAPATASSHSWVWRMHGFYAESTGNWSRAAECLERALQADPEDTAAAYKLGLAWERLGSHALAQRLIGHSRVMERLSLGTFRLLVSDQSRTELMTPVVVGISEAALSLGRCREALDWSAVALEWYPDDRNVLALRDQAQTCLASTRAPYADGDVRLLLAEAAAAKGPTGQKNPAGDTKQFSAPLKADDAAAAIRLTDCHAEAGIDFQYVNGSSEFKYLIETVGGGVAVLDYDNDGWPDLYFPQGGPIPLDAATNPHADRLYRNLGDGSFRDVTAGAGLGDRQYSQGCAAADYDNDGDQDLVVANYGTNVFYRNNGDGTFTEATALVGLSGERWSSSLAFADLDRDGNLDLYVVTYVLDALKICRAANGRASTCSPANFTAEDDLVFRNQGDGTFADVTRSAGILIPEGKGLGIVVADFDNDRWPDVYVANDGTPNFLFRNLGADGRGGLRFEEIGLAAGCAVDADGKAQAGMGIACGDLNDDGLLDLYVTNFYLESGTLYVNHGDMQFEDATRRANLKGPTRQMLGFGTQAIDFDLDGRLDLLIANGHIDDFRFRGEPWKMPPQLFVNRGGLRFEDGSAAAGEHFAGAWLGRGLARVDFNRDGKPDAVIVHQDRPVALLRNETESVGNAFVLELRGTRSNRDAIGARIVYRCGDISRTREITGGDGFFVTNERRQILGLGTAHEIEALEILWPSGLHQSWNHIPANQTWTVVEGHEPGQ
jgi:tetratricopeptide (TPR) repeat protein